LEMLFPPFYRAPNTVARQIGGAGVGLHGCREIAVRHGGTIVSTKKEGQGSTFTVTLPLFFAES